MKEHPCELCGKIFDRKSNWIYHTQNKKNPCVPKNVLPLNLSSNIPPVPPPIPPQKPQQINSTINLIKKNIDSDKAKLECKYCLKLFSRQDNLKRHFDGERCEVLKLQKQQARNTN